MTKYAPPSIWTDEYNEPSVDNLRKLVILDAKKAFDKTRSKIHALGAYDEKVLWFGDCWFWTIAFVSENMDKPLAILIPSAEDLQIASPLTHEFIEQLSTRRCSQRLFLRTVFVGSTCMTEARSSLIDNATGLPEVIL